MTSRRSETRARTGLINVRVNDDERTRWTAFARRKGLSLAGLLRLGVEVVLLEDELAEVDRRARR